MGPVELADLAPEIRSEIELLSRWWPRSNMAFKENCIERIAYASQWFAGYTPVSQGRVIQLVQALVAEQVASERSEG